MAMSAGHRFKFDGDVCIWDKNSQVRWKFPSKKKPQNKPKQKTKKNKQTNKEKTEDDIRNDHTETWVFNGWN